MATCCMCILPQPALHTCSRSLQNQPCLGSQSAAVLTLSLVMSLCDPVRCAALSTTRIPTREPGSVAASLSVTSSPGFLVVLLQLRDTCRSQSGQSRTNHQIRQHCTESYTNFIPLYTVKSGNVAIRFSSGKLV